MEKIWSWRTWKKVQDWSGYNSKNIDKKLKSGWGKNWWPIAIVKMAAIIIIIIILLVRF